MNIFKDRKPVYRSLRFAALYLFSGALWFLSGDRLLSMVFPGSSIQRYIYEVQGFSFILFTALLLFIFIYRNMRAEKRIRNDLEFGMAQMEAALREKDLLLREVHHRVMNNLQIVSSILNLQMDRLTNQADAELFRSSQGRILAMAMIHERLYQTNNLAVINMKEYIGEYIRTQAIHRIEKRDIFVENNSEPVILDLDSAIPCGLILNELVTNALHHAFPDNRQGRVTLTCSKQKETISLTVEDSGIGFEKLEDSKENALGMDLVESLVRQLRGTFEVVSVGGTKAVVRFPCQLEYN